MEQVTNQSTPIFTTYKILNGTITVNDVQVIQGSTMKFIYIGIGVGGFMFNFVSLFILIGYKPLRSYSSYFYILALTVAGGLSYVLLILHSIFDNNRRIYDETDSMDLFICKFWSSRGMVIWSMFSAVYMIVVIAVDQFVAVVFPLFYRTTFSKKKVFPCIFIISAVVMATFSVLPHMLKMVQIDKRGYCLFATQDALGGLQYFNIFYSSIMQYFLPLGTIVFSYSKIAWTLQKKSRFISDITESAAPKVDIPSDKASNVIARKCNGNNQGTSSSRLITRCHKILRFIQCSWFETEVGSIRAIKSYGRRNSPMAVSVLKTSFWVAVCYICCYSIAQIHYLLYNLMVVNTPLNSPIFQVQFLLLYLHASFNSFIFYVKLDKFKEGLHFMVENCFRFVFKPDV